MDPLHRALRETQADLEQVSSHLGLIREAIEHGEAAPTREELARRLSVSLVTTLGFERVAMVLPDESGALDVAAAYSQTERFGGPREEHEAWATRLARDVLDEGTLVRWGGAGVGASRRRPRDVEEDVIGLPLETGGEILGAILCTEVAGRSWTLARHRALELVGQSIAQVVALQRGRREIEGARERLETQLRAAQTKLARQGERIDTLSSSLDLADRAKETFLGLLSHELRTPLAAMLGYTSLLREGDAGSVNEEQRGFLDRIESNGRRLGYLLEDLLFLTEAESTRIHPAKTEVELTPLIDAVCRALPAPAEGEAPHLEVNVAPGADRLQGDPALVRRLLFHLLDEAWRTECRRVRVDVERADHRRVLLRVATDGGPPSPQAGAPSLRIGQSLVRLCTSLLDGRSRLTGSPSGVRAEVWLPRVDTTAKTGLATRREPGGQAAAKRPPASRRGLR